MPDYIDASALVAVLLNEADSPLIDNLVRDRSDAVLVSDFCIAECSSAITTYGRRAGLEPDTVKAIWLNLDAWVATFGERITTDPADVAASIALVRTPEHKLRAADAIHVAACARLQARLITLDKRMTTAASALGVPCINPAGDSGLQKD